MSEGISPASEELKPQIPPEDTIDLVALRTALDDMPPKKLVEKLCSLIVTYFFGYRRC